jgi:hypothetical protein
MLRNVWIFKIRLKRYKNCEELQEELQLQLQLYLFYFIFQFLKLCAFLKLYYVFTCWYATYGYIAGRYFGFAFVYILFVIGIKNWIL